MEFYGMIQETRDRIEALEGIVNDIGHLKRDWEELEDRVYGGFEIVDKSDAYIELYVIMDELDSIEYLVGIENI